MTVIASLLSILAQTWTFYKWAFMWRSLSWFPWSKTLKILLMGIFFYGCHFYRFNDVSVL